MDHTKSGRGSRTRLETLGHHERTPTPRFSITPAQPTPGTSVTFDASNSADEYKIRRHKWDLDGDDTVDATGKRVTYTYDETGCSYDDCLSVGADERDFPVQDSVAEPRHVHVPDARREQVRQIRRQETRLYEYRAHGQNSEDDTLCRTEQVSSALLGWEQPAAQLLSLAVEEL